MVCGPFEGSYRLRELSLTACETRVWMVLETVNVSCGGEMCLRGERNLKEESVTLATKERSFVNEPLFPDKARIYCNTPPQKNASSFAVDSAPSQPCQAWTTCPTRSCCSS